MSERSIAQRLTIHEDRETLEVDFSGMTFAGAAEVEAFYDVVDARVGESGSRWYFLVNYEDCTIVPEAWAAFAERGKRANISYGLGTVRFGVNVDVRESIRSHATSNSPSKASDKLSSAHSIPIGSRRRISPFQDRIRTTLCGLQMRSSRQSRMIPSGPSIVGLTASLPRRLKPRTCGTKLLTPHGRRLIPVYSSTTRSTNGTHVRPADQSTHRIHVPSICSSTIRRAISPR